MALASTNNGDRLIIANEARYWSRNVGEYLIIIDSFKTAERSGSAAAHSGVCCNRLFGAPSLGTITNRKKTPMWV